VPALNEPTSFEAFAGIVARLRAPDGCPWDRKQTHLTLRSHLLEECYETLAALDMGNTAKLREELGDLLLQIVLHAQIASEAGEFSISDVLVSIHDKIVRRHPHVFGTAHVEGVEEVLHNWERLKELERGEAGGAAGLLDGVPRALPALSQAQELQDRAARVGFDWPSVDGVLDKVREEIGEIGRAASGAEAAAELGDLLFVLVNLARWKEADAESLLRQASEKFRRRFHYIEERSGRDGRRLTDLSSDQMNALWDESKKEEADNLRSAG
jgi:tetrapyrrole methylase family protein/MazG family protein